MQISTFQIIGDRCILYIASRTGFPFSSRLLEYIGDISILSTKKKISRSMIQEEAY